MNIIRRLFNRLDDRDFENVCAVGRWRGRHKWAGWGFVTPGRDGNPGTEMRVCTRCNLIQTRAALEPQS